MPHDDKDDLKEEGDIKVMGSHAIFRMDAGKEAPGCVVGFQFEQQAMYRQFKEIISRPIPNVSELRINFILLHSEHSRNLSFFLFFSLISAKIVCDVTMKHIIVMSSITMGT